MKLSKRKMMLVSFMLFSLFFGAGNLIFPPFLGQNAGSNMPVALLGFIVTAVVLPVLGVVVVAKFNGLEKLARKVNPVFAVVFTIAIYLSIGPGLGIPRAASVPFEMAIAPYMPEGSSFTLFMLIYSLVFFLIAGWLALAPKKLVDRIGKVMTPTLLTLLVILFVSFLFGGKQSVAEPQAAYANNAFVTGFLEGYNTMDAIAALNFGLVIAATLNTLNVTDKKDVINHTIKAGAVAGTILALVYAMLCFMGMKSSGVYELQDNGAWTLRCIVKEVFGAPGAVLLALIFTLACLTTCVGLITSISQYFSMLVKKVSYRKWAVIVTFFSFAVCNLGLNKILAVSVPVLNMVYPVSIVLIVLGLLDNLFKNNKFMYPVTVSLVAIESILHAVDGMGVPLGFIHKGLSFLPFYEKGMGWVVVAVASALLSFAMYGVQLLLKKSKKTNKEKTEQTV